MRKSALPRREARAQSGAQAGRVPAKNRPVDRLKYQRLVVHIDDFHQRLKGSVIDEIAIDLSVFLDEHVKGRHQRRAFLALCLDNGI